MTVVDDDTSRLWQLLTELSAQLSANKEHCDNLKRQCEQLKTQAIHTGTGFTLRRFNTDITKEQFESELERFNATLVLENQALQYENRQLSMLLKDYEGTLDNVMAKFRSFAHSSQQYELDSARHYETLLIQNGIGNGASGPIASTSFNHSNGLVPTNLNGHQAVQGTRPPVLDVSDPLALQWSLAHLSSLVRKALRSMQGEDDVSSSDDSSDDVDECSNASEYGGDGTTSQVSSSRDVQQTTQLSSALSAISNAASNQVKQSNASQSTSQHSHHDGTKHDEGEGGYVSLLHHTGFDKSAAALERDIELERLRKENETLRQMLAVANEIPLPPVADQASQAAPTSQE